MRRLRPPARLRLPRLCMPARYGLWRVRARLPGRTLALLLAFILAFAGICALLERRAAPQVRALAENAARQQASTAISLAVEEILTEERVTYERLVGYGETGGVRSIQVDAREVNLLRGKINEAVEAAVTLRRGRIRLPLGALLGSSLFAGAGPKIAVPLAMTGHALSDIRSELSSGGVNQTMHRILMDLRVSISVILPGGAVTSVIEMTVCLAETVIVGQVPGGLITSK